MNLNNNATYKKLFFCAFSSNLKKREDFPVPTIIQPNSKSPNYFQISTISKICFLCEMTNC